MNDYIPEHGNSGDACIALATRSQLDGFRKEHPGATFFRGGGLCWYPNLHEALRNAPGPLVILPSSIDDHVAKILAERKDVFLYCRGKRSLAIAKKHGIECALQPDLAFNLDLQSKGKGSETLWCFRGDIESATNFRTADNWDVSLLRHAVWTLENCEPSAREFIDAIDAFAEVETDRLHVAIIAALLGKVVTLYGTADHKVQEVFEFSLAKFPNVTFRRASDSWRRAAGDCHSSILPSRSEALRSGTFPPCRKSPGSGSRRADVGRRPEQRGGSGLLAFPPPGHPHPFERLLAAGPCTRGRRRGRSGSLT